MRTMALAVRWSAAALLLCPIGIAATEPVATAGSQEAAGKADIVVNGARERRSGWKRAESQHVIVTSDGSEAELSRTTRNLERLYDLMSRIYRPGDQPDDTVKIRVTLFGSADALRSAELARVPQTEGPYSANFSGQSYYDPRDDGDVLAVSRVDQVIELDTRKAHILDCDDMYAAGMDCLEKPPPYHPPIIRPWEETLYSGFARHFVLTYVPAGYPRWYLDGVGALFSTFDPRKDGSLDYARAPEDFRLVFRSYGPVNVREVLTGRYLEERSARAEWTPYHAWLLAHFFLYSNLKPERRAQFSRYLAAIHQGTPMAEAAKVFGPLGPLQREIMSYAGRSRLSYARTEPAGSADPEPVITPLSLGHAAMVEAGIELMAGAPGPGDPRSGLGAPWATSGDGAGEAEVRRREAWLATVRARLMALPYDADAILIATAAECRSGHPGQCLADAERVLARSPDDVRALAWKGIALTDQAVAAPGPERADRLAAARGTIERAIRLDGDAPLPRIAYFESFAKSGEPVPDRAMVAMAEAVRIVPGAPGPRLYLGAELVRQGKADLARRLLSPVLYGPYDASERSAAALLFGRAGGTAPAAPPVAR